jgi:hypothetical protein
MCRYEPFGSWLEAVYNVWAKYRMEVTGREAMDIILSKRKVQDSAMCTPEKECEIPAAKR